MIFGVQDSGRASLGNAGPGNLCVLREFPFVQQGVTMIDCLRSGQS
jgi:hypothetical protein